MKKIETLSLYVFMLLIAGCLAWSCSDDDDPDEIVISKQDLPEKARLFIDTHFPDLVIQKIDKETEVAGSEYDVKVRDGTEVEFDSKGEWTDVKAAGGEAVPDAIVPTQIKEYVEKTFAGTRIKEISRSLLGWEIELSNDVDVNFDADFNVVRVDV